MKFHFTALRATTVAINLALFAPALAFGNTTGASVGATAIDAVQREQVEKSFARTGNAAIGAIRDARFAILSGQPKMARDLLDSAKAFLDLAVREAPTYATTTKTIVDGKTVATLSEKRETESVPVDNRLLFASSFLATAERKKYVDKANEYFAAGKSDLALKELAQADVQFVRYWLPLAATLESVEQARQFVLAGDYFEAIVALRAVEDNVTSRPIELSDAITSAYR